MESTRCGLLFFLSLISLRLFAGEMNLSGVFDGFGETSLTEQRKIEERMEQELSKFSSVRSSRVMIPMGEMAKSESVWGTSEPRVLPVDVIVKLKKRRRLTRDEYQGITNLVTSGLSEENRVVEVTLRDDDGHVWSDDSVETQGFFKAASAESEIYDRLATQWGKDVTWTFVNVSEKDSACKINGTYSGQNKEIPSEVRREVMNLLQDLCSSARLNVVPQTLQAGTSESSAWLDWLERAAFALVGFALWGLVAKWRSRKTPSRVETETADENAIILTKIVERSPDEAAKWMVRALLSKSETETSPQDHLPLHEVTPD